MVYVCLSTVLLKKFKMRITSEEEGDCEKDRRRRRVMRAEVTLIYSLLPTLQLEVKGQNPGNTFRDTHVFFNTHVGFVHHLCISLVATNLSVSSDWMFVLICLNASLYKGLGLSLCGQLSTCYLAEVCKYLKLQQILHTIVYLWLYIYIYI